MNIWCGKPKVENYNKICMPMTFKVNWIGANYDMWENYEKINNLVSRLVIKDSGAIHDFHTGYLRSPFSSTKFV